MKKREQILLVLLAALIILLGGFKFLIEPQINALRLAKDELEQMKEEDQRAKDNVLKAENVLKENKTIEESIKESYAVFFPELKNNKVHVFFDAIANSTGIDYTNFIMSPKVVSTIVNPPMSEITVTYPAKDRASAINISNGREENSAKTKVDEKSKDKEKEDKGTELERMNLNINFSSSYEQMKAYVDAIKNSGRTVRITSITASDDAEGLLNVNIIAECFALKKISDDTFLDDTLAKPSGKTNPFS